MVTATANYVFDANFTSKKSFTDSGWKSFADEGLQFKQQCWAFTIHNWKLSSLQEYQGTQQKIVIVSPLQGLDTMTSKYRMIKFEINDFHPFKQR